MSILPVHMVVVDDYSRQFAWIGFGSGDWGEPVSVWAWPHLVWHMTGHITTNTDNAKIHILGSNDFTCYGRLHTMEQPPNDDDPPELWPDATVLDGGYVTAPGQVKHNFTDCMFDGSNLPRPRWVAPRRPRDGGTHNDLAVVLFCTRPWPGRGDNP